MHKIRITILGGGSPYTLQFFKQLELTPIFSSCSFILQGKDVNKLGEIKAFLSRRFKDADFEIVTSLERSLLNADIVIHQIRYGGLQWRKTCENICWEQKVLLDETMGLAPLLTWIRYKTEINEVVDAIGKYAPTALVINLTNPLSLMCSIMGDKGIVAYGICELPIVTLRELIKQFNLTENQIEWSYYGLNHRGFLYNIKYGTVDLLDKLVENEYYNGLVNTSVIAKLNGYPLKYYFSYDKPLPSLPGRAETLFNLKEELFDELNHANDFPNALNKRDMSWYDDAMIPVINAWGGGKEWVGTLNITQAKTDLTWETKVKVSANKIEEFSSNTPQYYGFLTEINAYVLHEKVALNFIRNTSLNTMLDTLEHDPTFLFRTGTALELKRIYNQIKQ